MTAFRTHPQDARRWQAVTERDPHAEGGFVYAVTTTGIYCRPTCPSRRPKRENVRFFGAADDAEAAGFRPCKRCAPREVPREQRIVAAVQARIEAHSETAQRAPTLADLGAELGLSPGHVQRVFARATGLSPKQYARAVRAERMARRLQAADTVAEAQYDAGFDSSRAAYEAAPEHLGMTPGRFKRGGAGEAIRYAHGDAPLGRFLIAVTERGVCALHLGADEDTAAELAAAFPAAELRRNDAALAPLVARVQRQLEVPGSTLALPLDIEATAFQRRVWNALRRIPPGETRSYAEVAVAIGAPNATRAVARACATNPVALAIPCHRVVRTDGALAGYRWGAERKRRLLEAEAKHARLA